MGKDIKVGNKKPNPKDRMAKPSWTPPPVVMLNNGIRQERKRILAILEKVAYVVLLADDVDGNLQTMEINELIAEIEGNSNA